MATRRMFSLDVVDTDVFLDMPPTSQNLYFHLGMRADDDGFVASPRKITSIVGSTIDDLNCLIQNGFLIPFDDGVVVVTHWKINNYLRPDRYKETLYLDDKGTLQLINGTYQRYTNGIPNDIPTVYPSVDTQDRLGKDRLGKDSVVGASAKTPPSDSIRLFEDLRTNYDFSEKLTESLRSWVRYKSERRESYKSQGMKSLLSQVSKHAAESGDEAVCNLIEMCMSNGWKGIIWDRLPKTEQKGEESAEDWTDTDDFYSRYLGDDP